MSLVHDLASVAPPPAWVDTSTATDVLQWTCTSGKKAAVRLTISDASLVPFGAPGLSRHLHHIDLPDRRIRIAVDVLDAGADVPRLVSEGLLHITRWFSDRHIVLPNNGDDQRLGDCGGPEAAYRE